MKKYIKYIKWLLAGLAIVIVLSMVFKIKSLNKEIITYDNNFKALNLEKDALTKEIIAYKFDTEQLEYINDSIIKDLNNTRKELGIKDKQLKQMQSIKTEVNTKDSIFIKDTIFKPTFVKLDTTIWNEWYRVKLSLEYPNKIEVQTHYKSELKAFAYSSKEIIGTPKKCWLGRLFQKKHNVIRVEVNDSNPYSIIKEKKFIIIE